VTISSTALAEAQKLHSTDPFVWCYEIEIPTDPPTRYRFVANYPSTITFRGNTYYPFPVAHSVVRSDVDGSLQSTTLSMSNVTKLIVSTLDTYEGLIGQPVRIMLVNTLELTSGRAAIEDDYTIETTAVDQEAVTARLALYNLYAVNFPGNRLMRGHCRFQYRGPECGYVVPESAGGLTSCDKSYDGPNGCIVHGTNENANGYTKRHPQRFGGFPGIPRPLTTGGL
jgi:lambda family phage minor tail protein L